VSGGAITRRGALLAGGVAAGVAGAAWAMPGLARGAARHARRAPIVATREGRVAGHVEHGALAWKGIPFAQAPLGPLRGRPPQVPLQRQGTLEADRYRGQAIQMALGPMRDALIGSEDCLYLNVWAPAEAGGNLPVIVWIHGGGFIVGSGAEPLYAGEYYAAQGGVVFVTINYRLGGWGYMHNPQVPGSANLAILDQIAALQWVQRNIAGFGGDPANVTVMGESAGAMSIGHLLGAPAAAGLFAKAIVQSGATSHFFSHGEQAEIAERVLFNAGLKSGEYDRFLALDAGAMQIAFRKTFESGGDGRIGPIAFHPGIDGTVFRQHPLRTLHRVPTLIGHCKSEMQFFKSMPGPTYAGTLAKAEALAGPAAWQGIKACYDKALHNAVPPEIELASDAFCVDASLRLANGLNAKGAPVWSYRFDYDKAGPLGAVHGSDLLFTFYRGGEAAPAGEGPHGPGNAPPAPMSAEAAGVARELWQSLVAFACHGNPRTAALPAWPRHDPQGIAYLSFDVKPVLHHDFMSPARRAAWAVLAPEQMV
jgi:para-nitrobenzyl esterase